MIQAPLILTLGLARADQERFDRLRTAHFPPERNVIAAHVTLFHQLPAEDEPGIRSVLGALSRTTPPFDIAVTGLRSLGRGTAFALDSQELQRLRGILAKSWADALTQQDRQGFRPHITVQNKVAPAEARSLLAELGLGFAPFSITATGLRLWHYRGGPWDLAGDYPFTYLPADPPAPPHR